jgi:hypothetical protein
MASEPAAIAAYLNAVIKLTASDNRYDTDMQITDFRISCFYIFIRILTGIEIPLHTIRFRHKAPDDVSEYQRIFRCPVTFSDKMNALVFNKIHLKTKILQPNRKLLEVFEKHAEQVLNSYLSTESYTRKVARLLVQSVDGSHNSVEYVAHKLAVSVRKLQNKLKEENTSFSELYDSVRKKNGCGISEGKRNIHC